MPAQSSTLESVLMRSWMRRGLPAFLLWPVSILFHAIVALRRKLYASGVFETVRLPVPVIVVGNTFIGGTGKTPLTIWLVETLRQAGYVPGVVSRGHGAPGSVPRLVTQASLPQDAGDEPVLIAMRARCPLAAGRDRAAAAQLLLSFHPEVNVIVSDDGLQHYRLGRDIEIMLFDARGRGNGWMLPAGPLREPVSRGADFTIINGGSADAIAQGAALMQLEGGRAELLRDRSQRISMSSLAAASVAPKPTRLAAAAGIGNPERFFGMLRDAGLKFDPLPLQDHYDFADNPFTGLAADMILITEKDAVKCSHIEGMKDDPRLWVVPVTARIDAAVAEKIVEKLRGYTTA
jgi:tetraacyldisaccharide 4'-kinase